MWVTASGDLSCRVLLLVLVLAGASADAARAASALAAGASATTRTTGGGGGDRSVVVVTRGDGAGRQQRGWHVKVALRALDGGSELGGDAAEPGQLLPAVV